MTSRVAQRDWPAIASALAAAIGRARLHPAVLATSARSRRTAPWAVAFSGGADSLALLLVVWALWPERRSRLVVLHFNHRLRGGAASRDAEFCRAVCRALRIKCRVGEWRDRPRGAVSEATARSARHEFFRAEMRRAKAKVLWLGHHQDDVAETLLMRLARGSGTSGLAAPRPVQRSDGRWFLRPLLTLKKSAVQAFLRAAGATWREDATNATPEFFRNRIRASVLPAWVAAAGRDAVAGAALARERLEEDDVALETWLAELAPFGCRGRELDLGRLAGKPRALWRRAMHRWLLTVRPATDLSRTGFEQLLERAQRGSDTRFSLGAAQFAVVRRGKLRLERR